MAEALARGHAITAFVRSPAQIDALPSSVKACVGDVVDTEQVAEAMRGHDLAISALRPPEGQEDSLVRLSGSVLAAAAQAGLRILVAGGAASLKVPGLNGHTVLTAPGFLPADVVPIARACQAQYDHCLADDQADWTYLCPPGLLTPGQRTRRYRVGSDTLLVDAAGNAAISMEDVVVALLNEAEAPHHKRSRFTVANSGGLVRGDARKWKICPSAAWPRSSGETSRPTTDCQIVRRVSFCKSYRLQGRSLSEVQSSPVLGEYLPSLDKY